MILFKVIAFQDKLNQVTVIINIVSHKETWNPGTTQVLVEPPPIPLIKIKQGDKAYKDFVNIKMRSDPKSATHDLY